MTYSSEIVIEPEFLRVNAKGELLFSDLFPLLDLIRNECKRTGSHRVLIDCSQMSGSISESERFAGGKLVAEIFRQSIKAALVMPAGQVTKLGELAAINRGAQFLVTTSIDEATQWLLSH